MLILIDLDGTLTNTVHPAWKPYKDGQSTMAPDSIPFFYDAKRFLQTRIQTGDSILIVSDSHPKWVTPIASMLGVESICLADKPNTKKFKDFVSSHPKYQSCIEGGDCIVIGDTKLDIEFGRSLKIPTIWFLPYIIRDDIKDDKDGIGDKRVSIKSGPTFVASSYTEIESILDNQLNNLYSLESVFVGEKSCKSIRFSSNPYQDGSYASIRCLARQEVGICDKYARADLYYQLSQSDRSQEFLNSIAQGVSTFINQPSINNEHWDYFTYLTDKASTTPPNKMKDIFDKIGTEIPKETLFSWEVNVIGSLRERNNYIERKNFLKESLFIKQNFIKPQDIEEKTNTQGPLYGKNIIILDDQLTTGATAWYVIQTLKEQGVRNILFIALFQMITIVYDEKKCPRCGKQMVVKIRRSDGKKFYSCPSSKFGGDGCDYTININQ